jgi:hypothetical protein
MSLTMEDRSAIIIIIILLLLSWHYYSKLTEDAVYNSTSSWPKAVRCSC